MSTKIGWTEETWNPVVGCTRVSAGCDHCYAAAMSHRLAAMHKPDYVGLTSLNGKGERHFNGTVRSLPHKLDVPLKWKKPRMIFVNSMSDLFHKDVPFDFIDKVFAVMALCPQHTFQILTKRPERAVNYFRRVMELGTNKKPGWECTPGKWIAMQYHEWVDSYEHYYWPLPNVWLGTSIEDQESAEQRLPFLLSCPAAVRFLSVEPLLGPIRYDFTGIDWVILGCESRPGKRMGRLSVDGKDNYAHWIGWVHIIISQCDLAGVKVFVKQIPDGDKVTTDLERFPRHLRIREMPREAVEV